MPNWCNNTVELYHDDPVMIERARKAFNDAKFLNEFVPIPEELTNPDTGSYGGPDADAKDQLRASLDEKYGYSGWYDFCIAHWGTKWDVGGDGYEAQDIPGGLILTFESAWAPPVAAYDKLEAQGFRIRAMYYEPGMGFAGIYEDGHDDYYEYGGMNSETIAETLPAELDEAFGISDDVAMWEEENKEEADNE